MSPSIILGIDLGTTFSVMAYIDEHGNAQIIPNAQGDNTTPSTVWYRGEDVTVGKEALARSGLYPDEVVLEIKRQMGDEDYTIHGHSPPEVSAAILRKLKQDAEAALGLPITRAVITVPAYFNDRQRKATREAGRLAGLEVIALPNEPTAAAVFYGIHQMQRNTRLLVHDLGGGTFDATVLELTGGSFHVRASDGSRRLGGKDWTDCLFDFVAEQYENLYGVSPQENQRVYQLLKANCERAKCDLAELPFATIALAYKGQSELLTVSLDEFNAVTAHLVTQTMVRVERALEKAHTTWGDIDIVLTVGGSSRLKAVQKALAEAAGQNAITFDSPDLIVAKGAALYTTSDFDQHTAGIVIRRPNGLVIAPIEESTTHGMGIVIIDQEREQPRFVTSVIIPSGSPIPAEMTREYTLPEKGEDHFNMPVVECEADGQNPYQCHINSTFKFSGWPAGQRPTRISVTYKYSRDAEIDLTALDLDRNVALKKEVIPFELPKLETTDKIVNVVTCLDCSGSMKGPPIQEAKDQFRKLLDRLVEEKKNIRMAFVSFGERAELRVPLTKDLKDIKEAVDALHPCGRTPMETALMLAMEQLQGLSDEPRYTIVISDGFPDDKRATTSAAAALKQGGIVLFVISIGQKGASYLRSLGEDYREIPSAEGISEAIYQFLRKIDRC